MLFDRESGAARRLARHRLDAAVANIGRGAALQADEVVVVRWFTGNVGVAAVREIDALDKALLAEEFEQAEDGCASDPEAPTPNILHEVCGGEVAFASCDERGEPPARAGEPNPRSVECVEHLFCHGATITHMRQSLNTVRGGATRPLAIVGACS